MESCLFVSLFESWCPSHIPDQLRLKPWGISIFLKFPWSLQCEAKLGNYCIRRNNPLLMFLLGWRLSFPQPPLSPDNPWYPHLFRQSCEFWLYYLFCRCLPNPPLYVGMNQEQIISVRRGPHTTKKLFLTAISNSIYTERFRYRDRDRDIWNDCVLNCIIQPTEKWLNDTDFHATTI